MTTVSTSTLTSGIDGASITVWKATRLASPPVYDTPVPLGIGAPDVGPLTAGTGFGGSGEVYFDWPFPDDMWIASALNGHVSWEKRGAGGNANISGLLDVLLTSPANNDVLTYETASSKWKNKPAVIGLPIRPAASQIIISIATSQTNFVELVNSTSQVRFTSGYTNNPLSIFGDGSVQTATGILDNNNGSMSVAKVIGINGVQIGSGFGLPATTNGLPIAGYINSSNVVQQWSWYIADLYINDSATDPNHWFYFCTANGDRTTSVWQRLKLAPDQSATAPAYVNAGTISTTDLGGSSNDHSYIQVSRCAPTGNITGVILEAGILPGQRVTVLNESAFTITFDVSGTSHVADGATSAIPALTCRTFTWDGVTNLWYREA